MVPLQHANRTFTVPREATEEITHDYYSNLFNNHVLSPHMKWGWICCSTGTPFRNLTWYFVDEGLHNTSAGQDKIWTPEKHFISHKYTDSVLHKLLARMQGSLQDSLFSEKPALCYCSRTVRYSISEKTAKPAYCLLSTNFSLRTTSFNEVPREYKRPLCLIFIDKGKLWLSWDSHHGCLAQPRRPFSVNKDSWRAMQKFHNRNTTSVQRY